MILLYCWKVHHGFFSSALSRKGGTVAESLSQTRVSSIVLWQWSHEAIYGFSCCLLMMSQCKMGSAAAWQSAVLLWDHSKVQSSCNDKCLFSWVNKVSDSIPGQTVIPIIHRGIKLWGVTAVFFFFCSCQFCWLSDAPGVNASCSLGLLRPSKHCRLYETSLLDDWNAIWGSQLHCKWMWGAAPVRTNKGDNMEKGDSSLVCFARA